MELSGYEKAAIFLSALDEDAAAEVMKCLDITEVEKISRHLASMKVVKREELDAVLQEVSEKLSNGDRHVGGQEFVRKILAKGLGEEDAQKIIERTRTEDPLEALKWVDGRTLSNFLSSEHPQTIALLISLLDPPKAAEVLSTLPDELKADVTARIARTEKISDNAVEELKYVIKSQLDISKTAGKKFDGPKMVAEILNNCDRATEQMVLDAIEEKDDTLADSIRQLMFIFDDLINIDDRGIQAILKEVSSDDLALALKTASEELKDKIFRNMSKRASEILKEEMETKGPVKVSEVEAAQQNIVKVARKLEEEGKIVIAGKGGEELVV